jgi:hypothetical protein
MADVFVSYSRADHARVEMLVRALEAHSVTVWWDRSLEQGADFGRLIRDEIHAAKACIVCWSASAADSQWVRAEADEGSHQNKYVGVLIASGRAPLPFNTMNNANLQPWNGAANDLQFLNMLAEVGKKLERSDIVELAKAQTGLLSDQEAAVRAAAEAQAVRLRLEHDRALAERMDPEAYLLFRVWRCALWKDKESYLKHTRLKGLVRGIGFYFTAFVFLLLCLVVLPVGWGWLLKVLAILLGTFVALIAVGSILHPIDFNAEKWRHKDYHMLNNWASYAFNKFGFDEYRQRNIRNPVWRELVERYNQFYDDDFKKKSKWDQWETIQPRLKEVKEHLDKRLENALGAEASVKRNWLEPR